MRRDKKKAKSRSGKVKETTYLSIAHNVVENSPKGKRAKPIVFANLGPEDEISSEMASSIARAFERYAAKRLAEEAKTVFRQSRHEGSTGSEQAWDHADASRVKKLDRVPVGAT